MSASVEAYRAECDAAATRAAGARASLWLVVGSFTVIPLAAIGLVFYLHATDVLVEGPFEWADFGWGVGLSVLAAFLAYRWTRSPRHRTLRMVALGLGVAIANGVFG